MLHAKGLRLLLLLYIHAEILVISKISKNTTCLLFPAQRQMIIQDKLVKELNDAKNAVEEYVYDLRDKLCGIYEKFVNEDVSAPLAPPIGIQDLVDIDMA